MYLKVFKDRADLIQALAHPKRLEILNLLAQKSLSVTEIYSMLDLPQANISQHLTKLRQVGVVAAKRDGKEIYYRLSDKQVTQFLPKSNLIKLTPLAHDPVCKMQLSPKTTAFKLKHQGQSYYFCASGCQKKFKSHPKKYLKE
jgi:ArsR family transcriptional regulator